MTPADADALLAPAVLPGAGVWLDLGAGDGLLTRALARRLGAGTVVAIDRTAPRVPPVADGAGIRAVTGDVRRLDRLGGVPDRVDGALCANVLHFVPEAGAVLAALARRLRPAGRVVVVEYDREPGSRRVPHPVPRSAIRALADGAGLGSVEVVGERASRFGGTLYVAVLQR